MGAYSDQDSCPVACVYGIEATYFLWGERPILTKEKLLKKKGWTQKIYFEFLTWHDKIVGKNGKNTFPNREYLLKILGGKKNVVKR